MTTEEIRAINSDKVLLISIKEEDGPLRVRLISRKKAVRKLNSEQQHVAYNIFDPYEHDAVGFRTDKFGALRSFYVCHKFKNAGLRELGTFGSCKSGCSIH